MDNIKRYQPYRYFVEGVGMVEASLFQYPAPSPRPRHNELDDTIKRMEQRRLLAICPRH